MEKVYISKGKYFENTFDSDLCLPLSQAGQGTPISHNQLGSVFWNRKLC